MEEGTYPVPRTPGPAPRPVIPIDALQPVVAIRQLPPPVIPAPPFAALSLNNLPVISPDCDDARSAANRGVAISSTGRLSGPKNVPRPRPFVLLPPVEDWALRERIKARLGDDADDFGIVIKDLQTGRGTAINSGQAYFSASLFKLFIMFEVLHQESLGLLKLTDELTITPFYDAQSVGPRLTSRCQKLTVRQALEAMMARSDNAVAILLQDLAGSGNINDSMVSLGMRDSHYLTEDLPTSARDVAQLLEGIGRYQAVSKSASEEMVRLLSLEQFDNGLRAGTPPGLRLAHKTGNYQGMTHDVGIVYGPLGAYLVVVLSDDANASAVTKDVASTVFDHFNATGPVAVATPRR